MVRMTCKLTSMLISTGMYNVTPNGKKPLVNNLGNINPGSIYVQKAIDSALAGFGYPFVAIAILFFSFTTILAYCYSAEINLGYVMGKAKQAWPKHALKFSILAVIFYGSTHSSELAWGLGDLGFGGMAWLNVFCIFSYLSKHLRY
ncbi:alanine:cation symporter family protein [Peribacillus frigoritolerans]